MKKNVTDDLLIDKLLGRPAKCRYETVVLSHDGLPIVIQNEPYLNDGTPMPTIFWLVGPVEVKEVSKLESNGWIKKLQQEIQQSVIDVIHKNYEIERKLIIKNSNYKSSIAVQGGVGGTTKGLKCLHAHLAYFLTGHFDIVGEKVAQMINLNINNYTIKHMCLMQGELL
jgi:hypothetical protein